MLLLQQSSATAAQRRWYFGCVDDTDGVSAETGLTFSGSELQLSKAGGAFANFAGTVTELSDGLYMYEATAGELDTLGVLAFKVEKTGVRTMLNLVGQVVAWNPYAGTGLSAAITSIAASAINAAAFANNAITASAIATDAITAAKIASDVPTEFGRMGDGSASFSSSTVLTTSPLTNTVDSHLKGATILITERLDPDGLGEITAAATGKKWCRTIVSAASNTVTVWPEIADRTTPGGGETVSYSYEIWESGTNLASLPNANAEAAGGLYTRGTGAGQINQDANGRIDTRTAAILDGVITAAKFAADAITSTVLATSAAEKVRDSILNYTLDTGRTVGGYLRKAYAWSFGKVTGQNSSTVTVYKSDGSTIEHTVAQDTVTGARNAASPAG
jgi:hypothetical protein